MICRMMLAYDVPMKCVVPINICYIYICVFRNMISWYRSRWWSKPNGGANPVVGQTQWWGKPNDEAEFHIGLGESHIGLGESHTGLGESHIGVGESHIGNVSSYDMFYFPYT